MVLTVPQAETHFRNLFTPYQRIRYLAWRTSKSTETFVGTLKDDTIIHMRPAPTFDFGTAYEIFLLRIYHPPTLDPKSVRRVIDLGGNVGYSCLYWAQKFPNSKIATFEPLPSHCEMIETHIRENGLAGRITLHRAAATARKGQAEFIDEFDGSRIMTAESDNLRKRPVIKVDLVDLFEVIGPEPVDILKLDIEGSEYEIFSDPRFDELAARTRWIAMEWHEQQPCHLGAGWCEKRLKDLGFEVEMERRPDVTEVGMIRAIRR